MMKAFIDTKDNRKMLLLILERANIAHLEKGNPIHIHAEEMKIPKINCNELLICLFETKEDALNWFKKHELIDSDTVFHEETTN